MQNASRWIYIVGRIVALALSTVALAFITVAAFIGRGYLFPAHREMMELHPHSLLFFKALGIGVLAFLIVGFLLRRTQPGKVAGLLGFAWVIAATVLIKYTKPAPRADALHVINNALAINAGDFSGLEKGGYLGIFPHQLGLVSFERFLFNMLDITDPLAGATAMYVVNAMATLITILALWRVVCYWGGGVAAQNLTLFLGFGSIPALLFVLFPYNMILGLGFFSIGMMSISRAFLGADGPMAKIVASAVFGALCFGLAAMVRSNFMIGIIAVVALAILGFLRTPRAGLLVIAALSVLLPAGLGYVNDSVYESKPGADFSGAQPTLVWVDMGLRDSNPNQRLPGWFNAEPRKVYGESGYNAELAEQVAAKNIRESLDKYQQDPAHGADFFWTKLRSTWTDPTFESIWSGPVGIKEPVSSIPIIDQIYKGAPIHLRLLTISNVWMLLIYVGALGSGIWYLIQRRPQTEIVYFPFIFLLGGVLFHLAWETKSQYVFPYVMWLIPSAGMAWGALIDGIRGKFPSTHRDRNKQTTGQEVD